MAKKKPERRADVLNEMADYLLGSGMSDATLRPAAAAIRDEHPDAALPLSIEGRPARRGVEGGSATRGGDARAGARRAAARLRLRGHARDLAVVLVAGSDPYLKLFFEAWG